MGSNTNNGYLNLILGPMFSGKSTKLIDYIRIHKKKGSNMLVIKPSIDVRYNNINEICTHNNEREKCISLGIDRLGDIFNFDSYDVVDYVFIEEAQFFSDIYDIVKRLTDIDKKIVFLSALNGDSNRELFGEIYKLLPLADNIEFLKALCSDCNDGTEAVYSKRLVPTHTQIFVAGADQYQPVCRKHFLQ